jgi:hypothetical protein
MKEGRNPTPENRPPFRVIRLMAFQLAFFFGAFFILGPSAGNHQPGNNLPGNASELLQKNLTFQELSAYFPFDPSPGPWEPDPSDKTDKVETSDNFDDEPAKSFSRSSDKQWLDVVAAKRLFRHLSLSSKNRDKVSLFVLHHSWKCFLH